MLQALTGKQPAIHPEARFASTAVILGEVSLEKQANIWYGAVLRGDMGSITIGENSNVQDNAVVHCGLNAPVTLGKNVTVGHAAILHGCTVEDNCLIGMGAILLDHCVIGAGSIIAAGSLVTQGTVIPPNSMVMGSPAKVKREVAPHELMATKANARLYCEEANLQLETVSES